MLIDTNREKAKFNVHFKSKGAAVEEPKKEYSKLLGGGLFMKFEYMNDDYDAFMDKLKSEKNDQKEKQKKLHKEEFKPASHKSKGKHENPFSETDNDYLFPFLREDDPYEAAKDEVLKHKWIEESKNLYGDFKPSYKESSLKIPGRTLFMEILEEVKKVLLTDWNDVNFVIGTNPEEMVEIKFENNAKDTAQGLKIYMNNFISANAVMRKYGLRKVAHYWGYKEDNYIYYMVAPPWVKLLVNDVVNFLKISQSQERQETESIAPSFSSDEEEMDARKKIKQRIKYTAGEKKPVLYSKGVAM